MRVATAGATAAAAEEPAAACNDMKTAMICSSKGPSLAMAAVFGTLIHLPPGWSRDD